MRVGSRPRTPRFAGHLGEGRGGPHRPLGGSCVRGSPSGGVGLVRSAGPRRFPCVSCPSLPPLTHRLGGCDGRWWGWLVRPAVPATGNRSPRCARPQHPQQWWRRMAMCSSLRAGRFGHCFCRVGERRRRHPATHRIADWAVIVGFDPSVPSTVRFLTHEGVVAEEVGFDPATLYL